MPPGAPCRRHSCRGPRKHPDRPRLSALRNRKVAKTIQRVESVVLTNAFTVSGWIHGGIPVGGWGTINAITKGARVEYKRYGGEKVEVREIVAKEDLTTEKICWLLRNPVDLLIAPEKGERFHQTTELDGIAWEIPMLLFDRTRQPAPWQRLEGEKAQVRAQSLTRTVLRMEAWLGGWSGLVLMRSFDVRGTFLIPQNVPLNHISIIDCTRWNRHRLQSGHFQVG